MWRRRTAILLERAFDSDSSQLEDFLGIQWKPSAYYQRGLDTAEAILKVAIEEEL